MARGRLVLHSKLEKFYDNVYFQPPANIQLEYPCVIYNKSDMNDIYGNDGVYIDFQQYKIIVIERDPDSNIPKTMKNSLEHCRITGYYTVDNLHHTTLTIYH